MICEITVSKFCNEDITKIENYDKAIADKEQVWDCHHKREIQDGFVIWSREELKKVSQYYDRPAEELIFLTHSEHSRLHNVGHKFSDETKAKQSQQRRGRVLTSEWKAKIGAGRKGKKHSPETIAKMKAKRKLQAPPLTGKKWKLVNGKRVYYMEVK